MNISDELSRFEICSKEYIFFKKVLEKLGPNFIRKSVDENLREAHNNLNKAMKNYFESYIFATAVIDSIEQLEKSQETSPLSNSVHSLYLNFVRKYLPSEELLQKPKLFGLSKENTLKAFENKNPKIEATSLKKLIEDNINSFCVQLIQCTGEPVFPGRDWKNAFHSTIKSLESKSTRFSHEETKEHSRKQLTGMIKTYYEELMKNVLLLSRLLSLHEQKLEFESNLVEMYLHRCHALFLKIKVFELKILEATYNQETVPALKKISTQIDQTELKLNEEQNEKTFALAEYLKLGEEYERSVDEYSVLIKSIREQQWAIDELNNRKSQYVASGHN